MTLKDGFKIMEEGRNPLRGDENGRGGGSQIPGTRLQSYQLEGKNYIFSKKIIFIIKLKAVQHELNFVNTRGS